MSLELTPSVILYNLRSHLRQHLPSQDSNTHHLKKILVAYSGGLDSHVLLHLLSQIPSNEFDLRAIYINHGLQSQAAEWSDHCHMICEELKVPFTSVNINLEITKGESLEELARNARYEALYAELEEGEILVTAHHQTDQAETLLLQLFRGAGVSGLAAMPNITKLDANGGTCLHLRPLLSQSRNALEDYAHEHKLNHIEDPSNKDTAFDRNFLRQEIMPLLRQRWLGIDKAISRSAALQADTKTLLDELAEQELPKVLAVSFSSNPKNEGKSTILTPIVIPELLKHSETKQRLLLRYWISQQGFSIPSFKKLEHIFSDVIESPQDKQPLLEWRGAELRRFQQHLYIMPPLSEHDETQVIPWQTNDDLYISSIDIILEADLVKAVSDESIIAEGITIRFRQGGETIEIPNRGNISLKNLFQELQVPPWLRSRLPLIYSGEKLLKIVGLEGFKNNKRHPPTF